MGRRHSRARRWATAAAMIGALSLALAGPAAAAPGDLDTSFGEGGHRITDLGGEDQAFGTAISPDGTIVVAGGTDTGASPPNFALARYGTSGSLDPSFGSGGIVVTQPGGAEGFLFSRAADVAIDSGGGIVAAGFASDATFENDFGLTRLRPDGSLDPSFGGDGLEVTHAGGDDVGESVAIGPDGRIVVAGISSGDFALARYNPDGSLDPSFGGDGLVTTDLGGFDWVQSVVIGPDGKIVAAGQTDAGTSPDDFAIARYNPDGSLDSSFGSGGLVTTDFGGDEQANAVVIAADGKIVAAGQTDHFGTSPDDFAIARYNPDGSLDSSFGSAGLGWTDFGGGFGGDAASDIAIAPDGKLIVGGTASGDFGVARYNRAGGLDPTFAGDGKQTTDIANNDQGRALALDPEGRIVVVGFSFVSGKSFSLARFEGDPVDLDTFIVGGPASGDAIATGEVELSFLSPSPGVVGFECSVEGSEFSACESPERLVDLADGPHSFAVRAVNTIHSRDPTPATRDFTVDTEVAIAIRGRKLRLNSKRIARAKLRCPASELTGHCRGVLKVRTRKAVPFRARKRKLALARSKFRVPAGRVKAVKLEVSKRKAGVVRRSKAARKVVAIAKVRDHVGNRATARKRMKLVPQRNRRG